MKITSDAVQCPLCGRFASITAAAARPGKQLHCPHCRAAYVITARQTLYTCETGIAVDVPLAFALKLTEDPPCTDPNPAA